MRMYPAHGAMSTMPLPGHAVPAGQPTSAPSFLSTSPSGTTVYTGFPAPSSTAMSAAASSFSTLAPDETGKAHKRKHHKSKKGKSSSSSSNNNNTSDSSKRSKLKSSRSRNSTYEPPAADANQDLWDDCMMTLVRLQMTGALTIAQASCLRFLCMQKSDVLRMMWIGVRNSGALNDSAVASLLCECLRVSPPMTQPMTQPMTRAVPTFVFPSAAPSLSSSSSATSTSFPSFAVQPVPAPRMVPASRTSDASPPAPRARKRPRPPTPAEALEVAHRFVRWLHGTGALVRDSTSGDGFRIDPERNWDGDDETSSQIVLLNGEGECVVRLPVFEENRSVLRWKVLPHLIASGLVISTGEERMARRFRRRNRKKSTLLCRCLSLDRLIELWPS